MTSTATRPMVGLLVLVVTIGLGWMLVQPDTAPGAAATPMSAVTSSSAAALPPAVAAPAAVGAPAGERTTKAEPIAVAPSAPEAALPDDVGEPVLVRGRVLGADGAPVAAATVRFVPSGRTLAAMGHVLPVHEHSSAVFYRNSVLEGLPLELLPRTATAADGSFALNGRSLTQGRVDPDDTVRSIGPPFDALLVTAPGRATRFQPLPRLGPPEHEAGDIVLDRAAGLVGRIVDEDGQPLVGVTVQPSASRPDRERLGEAAPGGRLYVVPGLHRVTTASDGRFALDGLWPGSLTLSVRTHGRVRLSRDVELDEDERHDLGDVVLPRGASVAGRVSSAAGAPIAGAEVLVTDRRIAERRHFDMVSSYPAGADTLLDEVDQVRERDRFDTAASDEAGRFRIDGLDAPNVTVYVLADGYEPVEIGDVGAGTLDLSVLLRPAALVMVEVVDGTTGAPQPDAHVMAMRMATDEPGEFDGKLAVLHGNETAALPGGPLPPGTFLVRGAGPRGTFVGASAAGRAPAHAVARGLQPGERAALRIELLPEGAVEGVVTDDGGAPVAGATVRLGPPGGRRMSWVEATTDEHGRFRFGELGTLEAGLYARAGGFGESDLHAVAVTEGERADVSLVLPRAARLTGTCIAADGSPLADARVMLDVAPFGFKFWELSPEFPDDTTSDADGRFAFDGLSPGTYRVEVGPALVADVVLEAGDERDLTLQTPLAARVTGRVTGGKEPVPPMRVEAKLVASAAGQRAWPDQVETGPTGEFEISLHVPGRYALRAKRSGSADSPAVEVVVAAGQHVVQDIVLPGGGLAGRAVVADTGEPIAGLELALAVDGRSKVTHTKTDDDGTFTFSHLPPGRYRCHSTGYIERSEPRAREQAYIGRWFDDVDVGADQCVDGLVLAFERGGVLEAVGLTTAGIPAKAGEKVQLVRIVGGELVSGTRSVLSFGGGRTRSTYEDQDLGGWWKGPLPLHDGRARFTGLPAGEYRLAIGAATPEEARDRGLPVVLGPGETREVEVRALPP